MKNETHIRNGAKSAKEVQSNPTESTEAFMKWLAAIPATPDEVTAPVMVKMEPEFWMIIARVAKHNETSVDKIISNLAIDYAIAIGNGSDRIMI